MKNGNDSVATVACACEDASAVCAACGRQVTAVILTALAADGSPAKGPASLCRVCVAAVRAVSDTQPMALRFEYPR